MIPEKIKKDLEKKQYAVYNHSAVQICSWTKKVLQGRGACYKQRFYGIHTHKCMQFSPAAIWCSNDCVYCWRPTELMNSEDFQLADEPGLVIDKMIEGRRRLLSGFGGREGTDLELWKDSLEPDHFAISLSGEPCIYPKLSELIRLLKKRGARSTFLVTNGTYPEVLKKLAKDALPSQLYVSVVASDRLTYQRIARPRLKDSWERFSKSLGMLKALPTRTVLRFTLIRGMNDSDPKGIAELFERASPNLIEIKAYMYLGYSRDRLKIENMPSHEQVKGYAQELLKMMPSLQCW